MLKKLINLSLLVLLCVAAFGQENQEYRQALNRLFQVSGTEQSYQAAIKQMYTMFREQYPSVDTKVWDDLEKEFSQTSLEDLTDMLVPVYSKYMTLEDLKELIEFYESPIGIKFAKNTPLIMQESMQVGQQWGMKIGEKLQQKMEQEGFGHQ